MKSPEELAEEHWQWMKGLLQYWPNISPFLDMIAYLCRTVFLHGFKHGKESKDE